MGITRSFTHLLVLFCCMVASRLLANGSVDLVIFSYDRPMQLYAILESSEAYLAAVNETHVVVRATNSAYQEAYKEVQRAFPQVKLHFQGKNPQRDFKPHLLQAIYSPTSPTPYVMFAVDDIIFSEWADLSVCAAALKKHKEALFFSLRLGKNITYCGRQSHEQLVPPGKKVAPNVYLWRFADVAVRGDWDYPHCVDATIYRKGDIKEFFHSAVYSNPNTLEKRWARMPPHRKQGLCFFHSKAINIPMNVVNQVIASPHINIGVAELQSRFIDGEKIDIFQFEEVNNNSPHVDYQPTFVKR